MLILGSLIEEGHVVPKTSSRGTVTSVAIESVGVPEEGMSRRWPMRRVAADANAHGVPCRPENPVQQLTRGGTGRGRHTRGKIVLQIGQ